MNSQMDNRDDQNTLDAQVPDNQLPPRKNKWFGRGIYGSKDVPIRLLDKLIILLVVVTLFLTIIFTINGGYHIAFDTGGGSEIASQKLRHGNLVKEPDIPIKPGYEFVGWVNEFEPDVMYNFALTKVSGDMTLIAQWKPATILIKFDLAGGSFGEDSIIEPRNVTFGEKYGELPIPWKDGCTFGGWIYSGDLIESDSVVTMTGEHVLTAQWK